MAYDSDVDVSRRNVLKGIAGATAATAVGAAATGTAAAADDAGEPVALQYFHEDWTTITDNLDRVADFGFDAIWIQQPARGAFGADEPVSRNNPPLGYQPVDFRNFDSALGNEAQLRTLIGTAHDKDIEVYVDTVLNHTAALPYDYFPQFSRRDFHNYGGITDDRDEYQVENGDLLGLKDLDQDSAYVREQLYNYMAKIADLGADGYRFDAAKHIPESFFENHAVEWAEEFDMFRVGEVLDGRESYVQDYVDTGMHAFDYPLYFVLMDAFDRDGPEDLSKLEGAGLVAQDPFHAMPFVENHDQDAPSQYELAHAFVLTTEGYPVVYNLYPDWVLDNDNIRNMVWVKQNLAGGETLWRYSDTDLIVYERSEHLLVGINNGDTDRSQWVQTSWSDQELKDYAGNGDRVTTAADGRVQITVPASGWTFYAPPGQGEPTTDDGSSGGSTGGNDDGSSGDGTTDDGSTDDGATDDGSTDDGTTDDGSDGSTDGGSSDDTSDGGSDDGSSDDGSTDDSSSDDGSTDDSSSDDGSTDDSSSDDGSTDDSSSDDGSVDDGTGDTSDGTTDDDTSDDTSEDTTDDGGSEDTTDDGTTGGSDDTTVDEDVGGGSPGTPLETGRAYVFRNLDTGAALEVTGGVTDNGADVQQWAYAGDEHQRWRVERTEGRYFKLLAPHSGKALDVAGVSEADGANVHQWAYVGGENQQWAIDDTGRGIKLTARHSGKVLEVVPDESGDGATVQQGRDEDDARQRWAAEPADTAETDTAVDIHNGAAYVLRNEASGKALNVAGISRDNGADVDQWDYEGGRNQHWRVEQTRDGYYRLLASHSGKALDVEERSTEDGANVHQWVYYAGDHQQWAIESTTTGIRLVSRHAGTVLAVADGGDDNGDTVQAVTDTGDPHQRWTLEQV